jgi:hypothetical protein
MKRLACASYSALNSAHSFIEAVAGHQLGDGVVLDVVGIKTDAVGHAGAPHARVGDGLAPGGLHGVGQEANDHVSRAVGRLHMAHRMHQPGQQHAVFAALVEPAVDHVARQPGDQAGDQQLQAGNLACGRRGMDVVQRQHLEHQLALVGRPAQAVERVQRGRSKRRLGTTRLPRDMPCSLSRLASGDSALIIPSKCVGQGFRYFEFHDVLSVSMAIGYGYGCLFLTKRS